MNLFIVNACHRFKVELALKLLLELNISRTIALFDYNSFKILNVYRGQLA